MTNDPDDFFLNMFQHDYDYYQIACLHTCSDLFADVVWTIWPYSRTSFKRYRKAKSQFDQNQNAISASMLKDAAKKLCPLVRQLVADLEEQEENEMKKKYKEQKHFDLESNCLVAQNLKAASYFLKKIQKLM